MNCVIGFITAKDMKEGKRIAHMLLGKRLISCCNIVPKIDSIYRWKGRIENTSESLLIVKTKKELINKTINEIKKMHSYEIPAIEFVDITEGNKDFLEWIGRETNGN